MVTLDVLSLLEKKGKTKYWLYHQLGMSYQNFSRMVNNETKSIRYENIEALCQIFGFLHSEKIDIHYRLFLHLDINKSRSYALFT